MYIWCSREQVYDLLGFAIKNDLKYDILLWEKENPIPCCNNKYLNDKEYCIYIHKGAVPKFRDISYARTIFHAPLNTKDKSLYNHPTIKPLWMIETLILNSSLEGETILDPFMGTGTTGVAAIKNNRNFIGFELDKTYFNTAQQRINDFKAQLTLF